MAKTIIEGLRIELIGKTEAALKAAVAAGELDAAEGYEICLEEPRDKANGELLDEYCDDADEKTPKPPV